MNPKLALCSRQLSAEVNSMETAHRNSSSSQSASGSRPSTSVADKFNVAPELVAYFEEEYARRLTAAQAVMQPFQVPPNHVPEPPPTRSTSASPGAAQSTSANEDSNKRARLGIPSKLQEC